MLASFLICIKVSFQKIGEKEDSEDYKHNEKFYQDNNPNLSAPVA